VSAYQRPAAHRAASRSPITRRRVNWLHFLKPRLPDFHTTVIIPFDNRIILVRPLDCTDLPGRYSEVAQTLDPISGTQFLAYAGRLCERRPLARSESGVAPRCDRGGWGALRSVGVGLLICVLFIDRLRAAEDRLMQLTVLIIHGAELRLGVDKMLAPCGETVKI
jgi:hypothetical protein